MSENIIVRASAQLFSFLLLAQSASAATATATAAAEVTAPAAIMRLSDLSFGEFGPADGSVILAPSGQRSATGEVALVPGPGGEPASFSLGGDPNASFAITLPEVVFIHQDIEASRSLVATSFTSSVSSNWDMADVTPHGNRIVSVGGTLAVSAAARPGRYSRAFDVTVEYN